MDVHYRPATADDMPACADLFLESWADLRARQNIPDDDPTPAPIMVAFYQHVLATGIFHVAEVDGRPAALACAILRGRQWFLSGFWARPGLQRRNIGMPVLRAVHQAGVEAGAAVFFVWASSDPTAMAAYMKMDMLPGSQILSFSGTASLPAQGDLGIRTEPLAGSFAGDLDQPIWGARRAADHAYFAASGLQGRQVVQDGERIGYYYHISGAIGPAAWSQPQHAVPLLTAACAEATASGSAVRFYVPGPNHTAVRFALSSGLRLTGYSHLLQSGPFGRLDQYLPAGPGLF